MRRGLPGVGSVKPASDSKGGKRVSALDVKHSPVNPVSEIAQILEEATTVTRERNDLLRRLVIQEGGNVYVLCHQYTDFETRVTDTFATLECAKEKCPSVKNWTEHPENPDGRVWRETLNEGEPMGYMSIHERHIQ
jgi:hypothetical protein